MHIYVTQVTVPTPWPDSEVGYRSVRLELKEDFEMMNAELEQWKGEYRRKTSSMESESKATEESLQPLQMKLLELEEQVKEQVQKINSVKASISKNDVRIQQLLRMVVSV